MAAGLIRTLVPVIALAACSPTSDAAPTQGARGGKTPVSETTTDRTMLAGVPAALVARDGACLLRRGGRPDATLAPTPPCRFLRAGGEVQRYAYPARGIDAVVMVVGTAAAPTQKAHFGIAAAISCGTVAHGLIVRGDTVTPARRPQRGGMYCVDQGRDEKDFYAVAHER